MQETDNTKCRANICRITRIAVSVAAGLFLLQLFCAIIGPPRWLTNWLNRSDLPPPPAPRYVVVLGGGSIPGGSSLMRGYCAAQYGRTLTNAATFIVALPTDGDPDKSSVGRMRDELVLHGIPASSVRMEYHGVDTWQQALGVRQLLGDEALQQPLVIVTSDYHMRRAVLYFHRAGFTQVSAMLAVDAPADANGGPWTWLRYAVWNNVIREVYITRELVALLGCKLKGP